MRAMRGAFTAGLLASATLIVVAVATAASSPPIKKPSPVLGIGIGMTIAASTHVAGARNVVVTLTMRYPMQCGDPGAGPLVVTLPQEGRNRPRSPAGSVLVGGKPIAARLADNRVTMTIPRRLGLKCTVIGPGRLPVTFTRRAGLGNPASPGFLSLHGDARQTHVRRHAFDQRLLRETSPGLSRAAWPSCGSRAPRRARRPRRPPRARPRAATGPTRRPS